MKLSALFSGALALFVNAGCSGPDQISLSAPIQTATDFCSTQTNQTRTACLRNLTAELEAACVPELIERTRSGTRIPGDLDACMDRTARSRHNLSYPDNTRDEEEAAPPGLNPVPHVSRPRIAPDFSPLYRQIVPPARTWRL
jgi:hypothetical protein